LRRNQRYGFKNGVATIDDLCVFTDIEKHKPRGSDWSSIRLDTSIAQLDQGPMACATLRKLSKELKLKQIIASGFAVAWLNPQAIIDGTILFGSMRSTLPENSAYLFIIGVCFASVVWFNTIALISYKIMDKFKRFIKYVNIICGMILLLFGINLGYSFVKMLLRILD
jgi:threonine/homoserine/homoserine lactone efflux protein